MLRILLLLAGLYSQPVMAIAAPPPMPEVIVLIVCKVKVAGPADQNSPFTKSTNLEWDTTNAKMHCRRETVQMYDSDLDKGAAPQPFNQTRCQRAGLLLGSNWDASHQNTNYRYWMAACPVPIVDDSKKPNDENYIIGWKIPDCGHRETVDCEVDTEI